MATKPRLRASPKGSLTSWARATAAGPANPGVSAPALGPGAQTVAGMVEGLSVRQGDDPATAPRVQTEAGVWQTASCSVHLLISHRRAQSGRRSEQADEGPSRLRHLPVPALGSGSSSRPGTSSRGRGWRSFQGRVSDCFYLHMMRATLLSFSRGPGPHGPLSSCFWCREFWPLSSSCLLLSARLG